MGKEPVMSAALLVGGVVALAVAAAVIVLVYRHEIEGATAELKQPEDLAEEGEILG